MARSLLLHTTTHGALRRTVHLFIEILNGHASLHAGAQRYHGRQTAGRQDIRRPFNIFSLSTLPYSRILIWLV